VLWQTWPCNMPYIWVPRKCSGLPDYAHSYFSQNFSWVLFQSTLWMCVQNFTLVALPIPEIIGSTQKIWAVPGYAHADFTPKFLMGFRLDGSYDYYRDSRKSRQKWQKKHSKLSWKSQKSRQKHGIKHRPKDHYICTVYKIQRLALSAIITCSARFSSVKFCHCGALTNSRKGKIHTSTMMSW